MSRQPFRRRGQHSDPTRESATAAEQRAYNRARRAADVQGQDINFEEFLRNRRENVVRRGRPSGQSQIAFHSGGMRWRSPQANVGSSSSSRRTSGARVSRNTSESIRSPQTPTISTYFRRITLGDDIVRSTDQADSTEAMVTNASTSTLSTPLASNRAHHASASERDATDVLVNIESEAENENHETNSQQNSIYGIDTTDIGIVRASLPGSPIETYEQDVHMSSSLSVEAEGPVANSDNPSQNLNENVMETNIDEDENERRLGTIDYICKTINNSLICTLCDGRSRSGCTLQDVCAQWTSALPDSFRGASDSLLNHPGMLSRNTPGINDFYAIHMPKLVFRSTAAEEPLSLASSERQTALHDADIQWTRTYDIDACVYVLQSLAAMRGMDLSLYPPFHATISQSLQFSVRIERHVRREAMRSEPVAHDQHGERITAFFERVQRPAGLNMQEVYTEARQEHDSDIPHINQERDTESEGGSDLDDGGLESDDVSEEASDSTPAVTAFEEINLHHCKNVVLGIPRYGGTERFKCMVFFPNLTVYRHRRTRKRMLYLNRNELETWVGVIVLPALRATYGRDHNAWHHFPQTFKDVQSRVVGQTKKGGSIDFRIPLSHACMAQFEAELLRRCATRSGFADPIFVLMAYGTKLIWRASRISDMLQRFHTDMQTMFDGSHFDPDHCYCDLGWEDALHHPTESLTLLRKTECLRAWQAQFDHSADSQQNRKQIYHWALTADAASAEVQISGNSDILTKQGITSAKAYNVCKELFATVIKSSIPYNEKLLELICVHPDNSKALFRDLSMKTDKLQSRQSVIYDAFLRIGQRLHHALDSNTQTAEGLGYGIRGEIRVRWRTLETLFHNDTGGLLLQTLEERLHQRDSQHRAYWIIPTRVTNLFWRRSIERWLWIIHAATAQIGTDTTLYPRATFEQQLQNSIAVRCALLFLQSLFDGKLSRRSAIYKKIYQQRTSQRRERQHEHHNSDEDQLVQLQGLNQQEIISLTGIAWLPDDLFATHNLPLTFQPRVLQNLGLIQSSIVRHAVDARLKLQTPFVRTRQRLLLAQQLASFIQARYQRCQDEIDANEDAEGRRELRNELRQHHRNCTLVKMVLVELGLQEYILDVYRHLHRRWLTEPGLGRDQTDSPTLTSAQRKAAYHQLDDYLKWSGLTRSEQLGHSGLRVATVRKLIPDFSFVNNISVPKDTASRKRPDPTFMNAAWPSMSWIDRLWPLFEVRHTEPENENWRTEWSNNRPSWDVLSFRRTIRDIHRVFETVWPVGTANNENSDDVTRLLLCKAELHIWLVFRTELKQFSAILKASEGHGSRRKQELKGLTVLQRTSFVSIEWNDALIHSITTLASRHYNPSIFQRTEQQAIFRQMSILSPYYTYLFPRASQHRLSSADDVLRVHYGQLNPRKIPKHNPNNDMYDDSIFIMHGAACIDAHIDRLQEDEERLTSTALEEAVAIERDIESELDDLWQEIQHRYTRVDRALHFT